MPLDPELKKALEGLGVLVTVGIGLTSCGASQIALVVGTGLWGWDELECLAKYLGKHLWRHEHGTNGTGTYPLGDGDDLGDYPALPGGPCS